VTRVNEALTMGSQGSSKNSGFDLHANASVGLTTRNSGSHPYRVVVSDESDDLRHRYSGSSTWTHIGGRTMTGTGPATVASGDFSAFIVMTGADSIGAKDSNTDFPGVETWIQSGGVWFRIFE
jgi:hypothetical protein